jgi:hypothetical protein
LASSHTGKRGHEVRGRRPRRYTYSPVAGRATAFYGQGRCSPAASRWRFLMFHGARSLRLATLKLGVATLVVGLASFTAAVLPATSASAERQRWCGAVRAGRCSPRFRTRRQHQVTTSAARWRCREHGRSWRPRVRRGNCLRLRQGPSRLADDADGNAARPAFAERLGLVRLLGRGFRKHRSDRRASSEQWRDGVRLRQGRVQLADRARSNPGRSDAYHY